MRARVEHRRREAGQADDPRTSEGRSVLIRGGLVRFRLARASRARARGWIKLRGRPRPCDPPEFRRARCRSRCLLSPPLPRQTGHRLRRCRPRSALVRAAPGSARARHNELVPRSWAFTMSPMG
jgi:hypothetical protein